MKENEIDKFSIPLKRKLNTSTSRSTFPFLNEISSVSDMSFVIQRDKNGIVQKGIGKA